MRRTPRQPRHPTHDRVEVEARHKKPQGKGRQLTLATKILRQFNSDPKKQRMVGNFVDGVKPELNVAGGTDYLEVDKINKNGLPNAGYRDKLKSEIDSLEFWDKIDPSRRIRYEYGDSPGVVDTRKAPVPAGK